MRNTKKFLAIGMSVVMALSMTACGSGVKSDDSAKTDDSSKTDAVAENDQSTGDDAAGDTTSNEPITISFWNSFTGADGDMLVDLVDRFNEENKDNITVEMDISSDFDSQLSTAFAGGTGPTMILSSSAYRFTYGDYLQNVQDIFDQTSLDQ